MIVDVHTHAPTSRGPCLTKREEERNDITPGRTFAREFSWEDHYKAMEPVDKAFVIGYPVSEKERKVKDLAYVTLDDVAEYVKYHEEKLIGVMWLDPLQENAFDELERGYKVLGLKVVKIGPIYDDFDPTDPVAIAFYHKVSEYGLPLMIHQATTFRGPGPRRLSYAKPDMIEVIAHAVPDLKIVIAHMGHPWYWDTVVLIRKEPNVYTDISAQFYRPWQFYNEILCAVEYGVHEKILFGTDFPITTPAETIAACRNINHLVEGTNLPKIPEEVMEGIIHRDALTLLGLTQ